MASQVSRDRHICCDWERTYTTLGDGTLAHGDAGGGKEDKSGLHLG
jgi:hypothetical protein